MSRRICEVQRDFGLSSGLRSEIIWDSLSPDQSDVLKLKIRTLIPDNAQKPEAVQTMRENLFDNVWAQRKYTNGTSLTAIIYVMVTQETDAAAALESRTYSCHPVFRTRKCINSNNSTGCCMVFVDEHARVYPNWNQYINNNILPKGTMVAPVNGVYTFNNDDEVELEINVTPLGGTNSQILNATDTIAGIGGLVATVPLVAALALPMAAPLLAAATAVSITTTAYSAMRSAQQLSDRRKHKQSTALTDREARNNWLGVAGAVVGLSASGATKALSSAAAAGKQITLATKVAVNGMNVSSILLSGTGIVNGVYDLYIKKNDEEDVISLNYLQLASSLLVFTHSINNMTIVSQISTTNQGASVLGNEMRNTMYKISRKMDKVLRSNRGLDIVRPLNEIPIRDILLNLHQSNLGLNGSTTLAGGAVISGALTQIGSSLANGNRVELDFTYLSEHLGLRFVERVTNPNSLVDILSAMAKYFCESVFHFLLNLVKICLQEFVEIIERALNTLISTEAVLYRILMYCVRKYNTFTYEFLESRTAEILNEVENYFNSLIPVNSTNTQRHCKDCNGFYNEYTV